MPTPTYDLISTTTLAASAPSVLFGSLPQNYRDLVIVINGKTASGTGAMGIGAQFNSDAGANYTNVFLAGDGSTPSAGVQTGQNHFPIGRLDTSGVNICSLNDYSATDKHKTGVFRYDNVIAVTVLRGARWANTAAVNSIFFYNSSANGEVFAAGTTFSIYGIIA